MAVEGADSSLGRVPARRLDDSRVPGSAHARVPSVVATRGCLGHRLTRESRLASLQRESEQGASMSSGGRPEAALLEGEAGRLPGGTIG